MTPIGASHHQNWSVGVVRKDRSYADAFGIDDRQRPGGLFFQKISSTRKEVQTMRLMQILGALARCERRGQHRLQRIRKHSRRSPKGVPVSVRRYRRGQRRPR